MAITSHDVAKLAGVSQPTVSRALRDHPRVSVETRTKVRDAAKKLGYVPNHAGRSLSTLSTGRIGIVSTQLANPFYTTLIAPLHQALAEVGYRTILVTDNGDDLQEMEPLVDGSLDGAIITSAFLDSTLPRELIKRGLPVVLVNRTTTGLGVDSVTVDDRNGGALIAELFIRNGHTDIGCLLGDQNVSTGRNGAKGFFETMAAAKVQIESSKVIEGEFSTSFGNEGMRKLMMSSSRPTAVYCSNDIIALGALAVCQEMNLRVPEDVTVVGFDDIEMSSWPMFNLTTVHTDITDLARVAAEMIVNRIQNPNHKPVKYVQDVHIVERGTHRKLDR